MKTRVRAKIVGRVQGVGFRPTVYRYATRLGLGGFVCNGPHGVTLEVEGDELKVGAFFNHLTSQPPRQAVIADIHTQILDAKGYERFDVVESEPDGDAAVHISPDLATCEDCLRELFDPADRRHRYPFINCTNCGPRFTIIRDLPYDRHKTSMAGFTMCPACEREYRDPNDRRFHAQPNACEECGPSLVILSEAKNLSSSTTQTLPLRGLRASAHCPQGDNAEVIASAVQLLREGAVVAIKSLGGYHLACDASSGEAVMRLRQRKRRPHKPFAVMFRDIATVKRHCVVGEVEEAELLSVARPIVVLARKPNTSTLHHSISPDSPTIGAFLPYTPLHHLLMQDFDALVMTSGNLTDEPIVSDESELRVLAPIADAVLSHNRPIVHKCDDSVLRVVHGQRQFLRRARGFVPNAIRIAHDSPQILAVGGELKNTFCLVRGGDAFLSQHIGDLKDYKTYEYFSREVAAWQKLMRIEPEVVAYDLHPSYLSTKFARQLCGSGVPVATGHAEDGAPTKPQALGVQHHHAHIVSVMAEHHLHEPLIGVALDGTGYGTDGTIWGGEFLVADRSDFERVAHFKQYPLPGGDKAIEEPWRMAASVLLTEGAISLFRGTIVPRNSEIVRRMIAAGFNSPLTSSAGRLFDAVAAMLGLCDAASYEAQAAIRLEAIAEPAVSGRYPFAVETGGRPWVLDFGATIRAILDERQRGVPVSEIAAKFHNTVAAAVAQVCGYVRAQRHINVVALSGGVWQNALLLSRTLEALRSRHFVVFTNVAVPPNDGGLALGQAAVAAALLSDCGSGVAAPILRAQPQSGGGADAAATTKGRPCA